MEIKDYLTSKGISFKEFKHGPVFTVEEAKNDPIYQSIQGIHSKNLFLKERKSRRFYLFVAAEHRPIDMKELGETLGDKIKFANENDLKEILGLVPGSVSPFGLINDSECKVKLLIDKEVWESDIVSFHPNMNTETLELTQEAFHHYVTSLSHAFAIID